MAKQTICYRSDAGNDFPTEFEALKDDLRFYIFNVIKNEATAKQLADAMTADLAPVRDHAAWLAAGGSLHQGPELLSPGIAALIQRMHDVTPYPSVPDHVSWDGARFVGTLSGEDKGADFFNRWYTRQGDFPPPGDRLDALKIGHTIRCLHDGRWGVFYGDERVSNNSYRHEQDAHQAAMALDAKAL